MKPQNRNFIVEVKRSRLAAKTRKRSIWGNVNLAKAIAEETALEPGAASPLEKFGEIGGQRPTEPRKRRILPVVAEPARLARPATAIHDDAIEEAVETAAENVPHAPSEVSNRRMRRKPRLQLMEKPLPPGQKWKRRLPRVLQHPD